MRAQCCICSDLFINSNDISIAATPCGHVFHEHCLAKWLTSSFACPTCRGVVVQNAIIPKLYFTFAEAEPDEADPEKLCSELQSLRAEVTELTREKSTQKAKVKELREKLKTKEEELAEINQQLRQEQNTNIMQQRMLEQFETQQKVYKEEKAEFHRTQKKLEEYKHVNLLIKGSSKECEELLQQYSGTSRSSIQQLVTYAGILKREYEQIKVEKRSLREQLDKHKKSSYTATRSLAEMKDHVRILQEQLARSEEDLKQAEKAGTALKAKVAKLQYAKKHPGQTSGSFLETPKGHNLSDNVFVETPKLSVEANSSKEDFVTPSTSQAAGSAVNDSKDDFDLDHSFDLFEESPQTQVKKSCEENNVRVVKITSAATASKPFKRIWAEPDDINSFPLNALNIMKKRERRGQLLGKTIIRKDYNGFGSTSSFTQPIGPPKFGGLKSSKVKRPRTGKKTINPSLPTLDAFINLS